MFCIQAEQAWIHCRTELKEITEGVEDFDLYFSMIGSNTNSNNIESEAAWLAKRTIQRAIGDLPPHVKQTLLNCLKRKNYPSHDYGNEPEPNTWLIKYRELFSGWSSLSRRYLLRKKHPHTSLHAIIPTNSEAWRPLAALIQAASAPTTSEAWRPFAAMIRAASSPRASSKSPAKAPTPASASASHAPAPSRSVPASSPSPTSKPSKKAPPPPPTIPSPSTTLPPPSLPVVLPPSRPRDSSPSRPNDDSKNKNLVIAVIAVGCLAALLLIALILVCCFKGNKNTKHPKDEQDGQRDEKPLNLGSSDVSPGNIYEG